MPKNRRVPLKPSLFKKFKKGYSSPLETITEFDEEGIDDGDASTVTSNTERLDAGIDESPSSSARSIMPASPALSPEYKHNSLNELKSESRHLLRKFEKRSLFFQWRDQISPEKFRDLIETQLQKIDKTTDISAMEKIKGFLKKRYDRLKLEYKAYKILDDISKLKGSEEYVKEQVTVLDYLTTDNLYKKADLKAKISEFLKYKVDLRSVQAETRANKTKFFRDQISDLTRISGPEVDNKVDNEKVSESTSPKGTSGMTRE